MHTYIDITIYTYIPENHITIELYFGDDGTRARRRTIIFKDGMRQKSGDGTMGNTHLKSLFGIINKYTDCTGSEPVRVKETATNATIPPRVRYS